MYICVQSGRLFKQLKAPTAIYEPVAEWSKALRSTYYVPLSISFCVAWVRIKVDKYIFILFKPLSHFAYGYSLT